MKKLICFLVIILGAWTAPGQVISSRIVDAESGEAIQGVDIFLNQSTIKTTTDEDGRFSLDVTALPWIPLIISHPGYKPLTAPNPATSLPALIAMSKKTEILKDVAVVPDLFPRSEKLQILRDELLGTSEAGFMCTILNEDDLVLHFDALNNILHVFCDGPIEIVNEYLGYRIFFYITDFRVFTSMYSLDKESYVGTQLQGLIRFEDLLPRSDKLQSRRKRAYNSSLEAFFSHLLKGSLKGSGFKLYTPTPGAAVKDLFVITPVSEDLRLNLRPERVIYRTDSDGNQEIYTPVKIAYNEDFRSTITFHTESILLDPGGSFKTPGAYSLSGDLAGKRLGDMMPRDYVAKKPGGR